jgi:arylsulfatase A-like enzyme
MTRTFTRRSFARTVAAGVSGLATAPWLRSAPSKPNIVFLLSDDVGIDLMGCYGSDRFKTPNIDALASTGIRFETCYSTPLCGPTRCQFNTGRYPFRTGGLTNRSWAAEGGLGPKAAAEFPIARLLKQAGYATCSSGKWRQLEQTPGDWGYDEWLTDPTAGGWYWEKDYTRNGKLTDAPKDAYIPDIAHEFAMDFMRRNRKGPFFLYYPTHLVHAPIVRTPDSAAGSKELYGDMITYLDKLVGKVVKEIDSLGIRENTLILFSGDNGTARQSGSVHGRQINGAKGSMWEGGSRVPLIANWKGTTPRNKVLPDMVDFSDFHATFSELAGVTRPSGTTFDGHSLAPQLRGEKGSPREWIYVQLGKNWYVREKSWKMNEASELFDMKEAPFVEKPVPAASDTADSAAARKRLTGVLATLNPAGGKVETFRDRDPNTGRKKGRKKKAG